MRHPHEPIIYLIIIITCLTVIFFFVFLILALIYLAIGRCCALCVCTELGLATDFWAATGSRETLEHCKQPGKILPKTQSLPFNRKSNSRFTKFLGHYFKCFEYLDARLNTLKGYVTPYLKCNGGPSSRGGSGIHFHPAAARLASLTQAHMCVKIRQKMQPAVI